MALGEAASGTAHCLQSRIISQQVLNLAHKIVGIDDRPRRTTGHGRACRIRKIPG